MASLPSVVTRSSSLTILSGALAACIAERLVSHSEADMSHAWPSLRLSPFTATAAAIQHYPQRWSGLEQPDPQWQDGMLLGRGDPRTRRGKVSYKRARKRLWVLLFFVSGRVHILL
jgi:hypothetical protein